MPRNPSPSSALRPLISAFGDPGAAMRGLIRQLQPGGTVVDEAYTEGGGRIAVERTRTLIEGGETLIFGAAFAGNGLMAVADILVQRKGKWHAYIFKPSTRMKERHLTDAAILDIIMKESGYAADEYFLLLLNMNYVRGEALDPLDLFVEERVTRKLFKVEPLVKSRLGMIRGMAEKDRRKRERGATGGFALKAPSAAAAATPAAEPVELIVERDPLEKYLSGLTYPLYFMDFESYQVAVPEWTGHWPFRQLPFQFSLHRLDAPGGEVHHTGFIAPPEGEPTGAFGEALLAATGSEGTVLVYNIDSEQLILDQLKADHPQWTGRIDDLRRRLVDLMVPFTQGWIKIPSIGAKLSLKYTLPALVPEMSYASLAISGGDDANQAYLAIRESRDPGYRKSVEEALHAYCEVDTLAMVRILERMRRLAEGDRQP